MDTVTNLFNQAQFYVTQNPWILLVVAALVYWFVIRPRWNAPTGSNADEMEEEEGFTSGQSAMYDE